MSNAWYESRRKAKEARAMRVLTFVERLIHLDRARRQPATPRNGDAQ